MNYSGLNKYSHFTLNQNSIYYEPSVPHVLQDVSKMTRPLPIEQRIKIVNAYEQGLGSVKEIAKIFDITTRTVLRYVAKYRDTGDLSPQPIPGRPPIMDEAKLSILKKIVLNNIDDTLEQYRAKFYEQTGIDVTVATICNACSALNLRRKKSLFCCGTRKRRCSIET